MLGCGNMFDLLLANATVATMADESPFGLVRDGAIGIADGKIAWVGPAMQAPREAETVRDLGGKVVTPGLVDPHTHIVYGEEGLIDFEVLSQGGQRWDLEPKGGGVGALGRRTRLLPEEAIYAASRARMSRLIANGVTTADRKSGPGLHRATESGRGAAVAKCRGVSAVRLEFASPAAVRAMAEAGTVAALLAGAHLTLHETQKPPVELFREMDVPMALATNSNPVGSPTVSPAAQMHLACYLFRLSAEEALRGFTVNGARALGLGETAGCIARGRAADLAVWDTDDPRGIAYAIGGAACLAVVKDGVVVHDAPAPQLRRP